MTAKEIIIKCLDENTKYPCRKHPCNKPEEEGNSGECCHQCSMDILEEYTAEVRAKAIYEVYKIAINENHDTLIEWLQNNISDV